MNYRVVGGPMDNPGPSRLVGPFGGVDRVLRVILSKKVTEF